MQASTEITHYKLDADKNVIPCSLEEWVRCSTWQQALEIHERIVAREEGEKE